VGLGHRSQLGGDLGVAAELQLGVDPPLDGPQPQLVEAAGVALDGLQARQVETS
jgi:hypothetical protein